MSELPDNKNLTPNNNPENVNEEPSLDQLLDLNWYDQFSPSRLYTMTLPDYPSLTYEEKSALFEQYRYEKTTGEQREAFLTESELRLKKYVIPNIEKMQKVLFGVSVWCDIVHNKKTLENSIVFRSGIGSDNPNFGNVFADGQAMVDMIRPYIEKIPSENRYDYLRRLHHNLASYISVAQDVLKRDE